MILKGRVFSIFILTCLFSTVDFAETITDTIILADEKSHDSSYIRRYDHYLNITGGLNSRNTEYQISYPQNNTRFILSPKETNQFYLGLDYSFLYLYYSFTPHLFNLNSDDSIKGNSNRSTFATGFSFARWSINFDYQNVKGYYLKNTDEFIPDWTKEDPYLQFPDLRTVQIGGQVSYNFNKRFSIPSLTSGKEQQLRSVITFFPILAYWNIKMKDEGNDTVQKPYNALTITNDINLLLPGAFNFVFAKNFYAAVFVGPIIGIDFFKANAYDKDARAISTSGNKISTGYYLRSSVGYTGSKFYTGIDVFARKYGHEEEDQKFSKYSYGVQVYAGTRFDPPRFLQRTVTWIQGQ